MSKLRTRLRFTRASSHQWVAEASTGTWAINWCQSGFLVRFVRGDTGARVTIGSYPTLRAARRVIESLEQAGVR